MNTHLNVSLHEQKLLLTPSREHEMKNKIKNSLSLVTHNSAWGFVIADFLAHQETKSTHDYLELLCEILDDIHDGPETMKPVLGESYRFFVQMMR